MKLIKTLCLMLLVSSNLLSSPRSVQAAAFGTCGKGSMASGTTTQTISSDGLQRTFLVHVPTGYDGAEPMPLVVSLHGFASDAEQQEIYTGWSTLADKKRFIAVYPNGTGMPQRWYAGESSYIGSLRVDDVAFFRALFDSLDQTLCIDDTRIFVNGLSNGGGMSNRLACEMADRIAAVGTVAGAYSPLNGGCQPARPIPIVAFHGDADPIVNFNGAPGQRLPPIKDWVAEWVKRNGCTQGPESILSSGDVNGIAYSDCQGNADVQFYTISGGGHTWPGSIPIPLLGKTSKDINATETMWAFYEAHPMPIRP